MKINADPQGSSLGAANLQLTTYYRLLTTMNRNYRAFLEMLSDLEDTVSELVKDMENEIADLEEENESLNEDIKDLQTELDELEFNAN